MLSCCLHQLRKQILTSLTIEIDLTKITLFDKPTLMTSLPTINVHACCVIRCETVYIDSSWGARVVGRLLAAAYTSVAARGEGSAFLLTILKCASAAYYRGMQALGHYWRVDVEVYSFQDWWKIQFCQSRPDNKVAVLCRHCTQIISRKMRYKIPSWKYFFYQLMVRWVVESVRHGGPIKIFFVPASAPQLV